MSNKYISRDNLELVIDGLKIGTQADWNENDKAASGYIRNKPFYTDGEEVYQIDLKYIPNSIARVRDVANDIAKVNSQKMDAVNPVGTGSFSMNRKADTEIGRYSHAEGSDTTASGFGAHAEGYDTTASGSFSHTEGYNTTASGDYSHAEGVNTIASGDYSHVEGNGTRSNSRSQNVIGEYNIIEELATYIQKELKTTSYTQIGSLARTYYSKTYSFDKENGEYTLTGDVGSNPDKTIYQNRTYYFIYGGSRGTTMYYNVSGGYVSGTSLRLYAGAIRYTATASKSNRSTYAHIAGNGTSHSARSNAHTLDWEGNAWYQGDVYVGSTSGTNKDEGSKKLATEEYADNKMSLEGTVNLPSVAQRLNMAYGSGKFITLVRDSNELDYCYSNDMHWIATSLPSSEWNKIYYVKDRFMLLGESDKALCSEDGINWSEITLPLSANWNSVAYGDSKFIAVAYDTGTAAYSEDGVNWTGVTLPDTAEWSEIAYGDGKFVVNKSTRTTIAYSEDGINWSTSNLPSRGGYSRIVYGNGKFLFINVTDEDGRGYKTYYSEDGINWNQGSLPSSYYWNSVVYGDGKFVAVASGNKIAYSEDGINWSLVTSSVGGLHDIAYGDDKYVAITLNTGEATYSYDGIDWKTEFARLIQNSQNITAEVKDVIFADVGIKNKNYITLIDDTTSYEYIIRMQNGNLTSICKASSLAVSTLPTKTTYTVGETLDLTDMVVTLTRQDGATEEVNNYSYTELDMSTAGTVDVTVSYVEAGETYSATLAVTITEATTTEETETTT